MVAVGVGASALAAPRTPLPPQPLEVAAVQSRTGPGVRHRLVVKTVDGLKARIDRHGRVGVLGRDTRWTPLVRTDVSPLLARAAKRSGRDQPDLGGLHVLRAKPGQDLVALGEALQALDGVEYAWVEAVKLEPPSEDTPSFLRDQRFHLALGAKAAWDAGFTGKGLRVLDIEYALDADHEDLDVYQEPGQTPTNPFGVDHGTASVGLVSARHDRTGCRGVAYGAKAAFFPEDTVEHGSRRAEAMLAACTNARPGDVVMLEMQAWADGAYAPAEVDPTVWTATQVCTDAGVVVVAAAGNGGRDLDDDGLAFWRERGDSGVILVGAGRPDDRAVESFSNRGSPVHLHAWGSGVTTLGYGDLAQVDGDPRRSYTAEFGGTSSATPMVAGVALLVQEAAIAQTGKPLAPRELRDLLVITGTAGSGGIGPLPHAARAIGFVHDPASATAAIDEGPGATPWIAGAAGLLAAVSGFGIATLGLLVALFGGLVLFLVVVVFLLRRP